MRTLCDVCESAAAILFCAADEASLCRACDDKVHLCNKLASRHVRVGVAEPSEVPRCDICENAPAFFYCEVDGTSLCLQCDMIVHVGGKRTHGRYLLLRQRVEFPGDKPGNGSTDEPGSQLNIGDAKREPHTSTLGGNGTPLNHRVSANLTPDDNIENDGKMENMFIDLNARPQRMLGQAPRNQEHGDALVENNHESESVVPDGYFKREPENSTQQYSQWHETAHETILKTNYRTFLFAAAQTFTQQQSKRGSFSIFLAASKNYAVSTGQSSS